MSSTIQYHDATQFGVQGTQFSNRTGDYTRLPGTAEGGIPEVVYNLSLQSAGLYIDFVTDSSEIHTRITLKEDAGRTHCAPEHSVDLYARQGRQWRWAGIPRERQDPTTEGPVCRGLPPGENLFRMYLPHAASIDSLEIGVEDDAVIGRGPVDKRRPVACYGTSIVHGFSASRPGMTMPAQLGRALDYPVLNLGFSGNAKMQPEMIPYLQMLDPAVFTIDCLPNMDPELVLERATPLLNALREARPSTPILLVENIVYQATYVLADKRGGWGPKNDVLKKVYGQLINDGFENLHYLTGEGLLGHDGDATQDGTHPNDLGMRRLAKAYEGALRPILDL